MREAIPSVDIYDLLAVLAKEVKKIIFVPLISGFIAYLCVSLIAPVYTAKTVFIPPQQQSAGSAVLQSLGALANLAGASTGIKNQIDQYVSLLQSNNVTNAIVNKYSLRDVYGVKNNAEARLSLLDKVKIDAGKKDGLISIEVDDTDPMRSAAIANAFVGELKRLINEFSLNDAKARRVFLEEQLDLAQKHFASAEKSLRKSRVNEATLKVEPRSAAESFLTLKAKITVAKIQIAALQHRVTPQSNEYKDAIANLNALESQLNSHSEMDAESDLGGYAAAYRNFKYRETLLELISKQYEIARMDEMREGSSIQVVDVAAAPERKSKPKKLLFSSAVAMLSEVFLIFYIYIRSRINLSKNDLGRAKGV